MRIKKIKKEIRVLVTMNNKRSNICFICIVKPFIYLNNIPESNSEYLVFGKSND